MSAKKTPKRDRITVVLSTAQAADLRLRARVHALTTSDYCARQLTNGAAAEPVPEVAALAELLRILAAVRAGPNPPKELVSALNSSMAKLIAPLLGRFK